jgi:ligand-binding sensor domain-containing protein
MISMRTTLKNRASLAATLLGCMLSVLPPAIPGARGGILTSFYEEGDWVSLTDFRFVNSLDIDSRVVYAGTSGGVERYNYLQNSWETPLTTSDGLPHADVSVVAFDPSRGELWCGTRNGLAVYHSDLKTWRVYTRADGLPGDAIEELVMGTSGAEGDYVYVKAGGSWVKIRKGIDLIERIPPGSVPGEEGGKRSGPLDPSVFGSAKYPFLSSSTEPDENLDTFPLTSLREDSWGTLWLGTWGGNIRSVSLVTHVWKEFRYGLASKSVSSLDRGEGHIWFGGGGGTSSVAITRMSIDMSDWDYWEEKNERPLRGAVVRDIEAAGGHLWVATNLNLARLDPGSGDWKKWGRSDGLPDDRVMCLESSGRNLWVGTELGLAVMNLDSLSLRQVAMQTGLLKVNDIASGAGRIWVATDKGFYSVGEQDSLGRPLAPIAEIAAEVLGIACVGDTIYLAARNGLHLYDAKAGAFSRDPYPGPVAGRRLLSVAADGKNIWVGTDTGVERYNRESGNWVSYTPQNFELLSSPVTRILPDGDHVWFASPEGATRFFWNDPSRDR